MGTTATAVRRMSLQQFLALPEDGPYAELEHGEFIEMVRPSFQHNKFVARLTSMIVDHIEASGLGDASSDILVILDEAEEVVYAPDVVFVSSENLGRIHEGRVWGAPDLVVEVLSPRGGFRDRGTKMDDYADAGVPWYWLIDPELGLVEEYRLTPEGYLRKQSTSTASVFTPTLFPELQIDFAKLMPKK